MAAFTNDDLKTLGAFDQAQGSTTDQLRLLRSIANRVGLYDAADVLARMILDTQLPPPPTIDEVNEKLGIVREVFDLDALFAEMEAFSTGSIVILDAETSDRLADAMATIDDDDQVIDFVRRVRIDLRVLPTYTEKVTRMSDKLSRAMMEMLS